MAKPALIVETEPDEPVQTVALVRTGGHAIPSLDEDEDTSMVTSLPLHLMSEHQIHDALRMDERDAQALHHRLHLETPQNHPVHDLRFRPGMAKSIMIANSQRHAAVQRLLVPVQAAPLND